MISETNRVNIYNKIINENINVVFMTKMVIVKNVLFRMFCVKTSEVNKNIEMGDQRKTVDLCKLINLQFTCIL